MLDARMGIDVGTTNWKVGVFAPDQEPIVESCPVRTAVDGDGMTVYDPDVLFKALEELFARFPRELLERVAHVGVTGMAEAGLLIDRESGRPMTDIWPWFDPRGERYVHLAKDRFSATGLPLHGKYSVFKVLAMRKTHSLEKAQWLGVPEYVVYRLTGGVQTDPTLAARTYAYTLKDGRYDTQWLLELGLPGTIFPKVRPSGASAGTIAGVKGFSSKATAAVCGHDHLLAAYACGALTAGRPFISTGTAQVLLQQIPFRGLTREDEASGLSFGASVTGGGLVWLGSLQAAGGSVNYWKELTGADYERFWLMASKAPTEPTGLLWLPYLNGRGAPQMAPEASAVLSGLRARHGAGDIYRGVLEGVAYETRRILDACRVQADGVAVAGGLSRQSVYMQILCDVLDRELQVSPYEEAALMGAALLAAGERPNGRQGAVRYAPDFERARAYQEHYHQYICVLSFFKEKEQDGGTEI